MSKENKVVKQKKLTTFGEYLAVRSVNKSEVARKVGISLTRLNRLCYDEKSYLRAYELQLIALAINVEPEKMQKDLFGDLELKEEFTPSEKIINSISKLLNEKELVNKFGITLHDIERISEILPYCVEEKNEAEILGILDLKRKSSKFAATLKACIEADWLTLHQKNIEGNIVNTYFTTDKGKKIIEVESK